MKHSLTYPKEYPYIMRSSTGVENLKITVRIISMWKQKNINRREDVRLIFIDEKFPSSGLRRTRINGESLNILIIIFFYSTVIDECFNCSISRMGIELVKFEPIISGPIEENTCVDVVGEVIEYKNLTNVPKEVTQPKLKLVIKLADEEEKVLNCTSWGQYAEQMSKHISSCKEDCVIVIIFGGIGSESKLPSIAHVSTVIATSKEEIFFNPTFKRSLVEIDEALEVGKGDGTIEESDVGEASIQIPANLLIKETTNPITSIVEVVYPFVADRLLDGKYFEERTILAPTLEVVEKVNDYIMSLLPGEEKVYFSSNSISQIDGINQDDKDLYSVEYLNSINILNHCLKLKVDQSYGLCNDTRLVVTRLMTHTIEAVIISEIETATKSLDKVT
ncbi:LOW QUALITY PROTEIN: hypothetical protein V2J09_016179 [Rumex salicifolius]